MVNLITDHIDIWTSAQTQKKNGGRGRGKNSNGQSPHGIKKLRELILELAVRGKLVPQDPNDEPASVLLEKIAKEKKWLIKEGKVKKQNKLPEISDEEKPFELPEGWEWSRVGNIGNTFNGNSVNARLKDEKYTNITGGLPFIATKDIGYGWDEFNYDNDVSIPKDEPKFKVAHKFAVLICSEGGSAGKKCGITNQNICFGNKLYANELYGNIEPNYILANYLSPMFYAQFRDKMTGIIGGISASKFNLLVLPLPPLSEQHRIVAKVDELLTLCDQLEQQQTVSNATHETLVETLLAAITSVADQDEFSKTWQQIADHFDTLFTTEQSIDLLKQTILQLAVMGKLSCLKENHTPIEKLIERIVIEKKSLGIPKKEEKTFMNEIKTAKDNIFNNRVYLKARVFCDFITKGTTPLSSELIPDGDVPFLKVYNIIDNNLDFNYRPIFIFNHVHQTKLKRSKLFPGDVIMNIVGPPLGKVAIINDQYPEWNMNQALAVFRPIAGIYNRYIFYMLSTSTILESVLKEVKGTAGQDNLSLEQCRDLLFPIPSIEEQQRIVAKLDELVVLCENLKSRLIDAQTTRVQFADAIVEMVVT